MKSIGEIREDVEIEMAVEGANVSTLALSNDSMQGGFVFPQSLTEKYRPQRFDEFAGMDKQRSELSTIEAVKENTI